jgi:hypothetical protein
MLPMLLLWTPPHLPQQLRELLVPRRFPVQQLLLQILPVQRSVQHWELQLPVLCFVRLPLLPVLLTVLVQPQPVEQSQESLPAVRPAVHWQSPPEPPHPQTQL